MRYLSEGIIGEVIPCDSVRELFGSRVHAPTIFNSVHYYLHQVSSRDFVRSASRCRLTDNT